ncbi:MAG: DUF58 domain-containing protein [Candidatus Zixiibacteriota bacterium]
MKGYDRAEAGKYLKPDTVAKLGNIELKARMVVEGFLIGLHKSPYHGFSVEFAEYRQYNPGDSIRHIDWRAYARTDRFYIKEFEEETNLRSYILLDKSASMSYKSSGISKLEYGKYLAAALTYLLINQKDAAGLMTFDTKIRRVLRPSSTRIGLFTMLKELSNAEAGGETVFSDIFYNLASRLKKRGLVVLISDLMDEPDDVIRSIKLFRHRNHEVIVFHVLDKDEIDFDFKKEAIFEDLESGDDLPIMPWALKSDYIKSINNYLKKLRSAFSESMIDYVLLSTETPFDVALMQFLHKRARLS